MVIDKSKLRRFCRNTDRLMLNDTAYAEIVATKLQMLGATTHTYRRVLSGDLTVMTCFYPERIGATTHTYRRVLSGDLTVVTYFYPERIGGTEILMMRRTSPGKGLNALPNGAWVVHFDSAVKFLKYIREANNG